MLRKTVLSKSAKNLSLAFFVLFCFGIARGQVSLNSLFGDDMVIQRDSEVCVWGKAEPGEVVSVSTTLNRHAKKAVADTKGNWQTFVKTPTAGKKFELAAKGQSNNVVIKNIIAGDIWVCAGQSNMGFPAYGDSQADKIFKLAAKYPNIRFYQRPNQGTDSPAEDVNGRWQVCDPETVKMFSAVGFWFAREVNDELNVPIGLIYSAIGGTNANSWLPAEAMRADPVLLPIMQEYDKLIPGYPERKAEVARKTAGYHAAVKKARQEGNPKPPIPGDICWKMIHGPMGPDHPARPGAYYNGMIAPMAKFAIKGVLWYQGEANAYGGQPRQYYTLFPTLIKCWRKNWGRDDLPFLFAQLPNFKNGGNWVIVRDAQLHTLKTVSDTAMVVGIDIGDPDDIHPTNKEPMGHRFALAALADVYGKDVIGSGPVYSRVKFYADKAMVSFEHIGSGLVAKGGELREFEICGKDKKFFPAKAVIMGDTVAVSSEEVINPIAVRYGWKNNPDCNLYNFEDLPASPFRTEGF